MVGGIFYEHGHRMIAAFVGMLSIVLAVWLWRVASSPAFLQSQSERAGDKRANAFTGDWIKWLGVAALGAVIAQGVLGGITVLFFLPPAVSAAHATLAQLFFCTVVVIALITSAWWRRERPLASDSGSPSVHSLAIATAAATLLQLILGAAFRHKGFGIIPHLIGAVVVTGMIFWLAGVLKRRFASVPVLRNAARVLHGLIGLQLVLGGAAWWSRIYGAQFPQPIPVTVTLTVVHTVTGALVLGTMVLVTFMCYRLVRMSGIAGVPAGEMQMREPTGVGVAVRQP